MLVLVARRGCMFTKRDFSQRLEGSRFGVYLPSLVIFVSVLVQPERVRTSGSLPGGLGTITPVNVPAFSSTRTTPNERMMSLPDYIQQTIQIHKTQPTPSEICVEHVKFLRFAEANGNFDKALQQLSAVRF